MSEDRDPYSDEILVRIPLSDEQVLNEAYRVAAEAQPKWAAMPPGERAAILRRAAAIIEVRGEEIVTWLIKESGSTRLKANVELRSTHAITLEATSASLGSEAAFCPRISPRRKTGCSGSRSVSQLLAHPPAPHSARVRSLKVGTLTDQPVKGLSNCPFGGEKNGGHGRFEWEKCKVFEALWKAGLAECDDVEVIVWGGRF